MTLAIAVEETYFDVEKLLWFVVHRFILIHGDKYGTQDELKSFANEVFMDVYTDYEHTKGSFRKRVGYILWKRLLDLARHSRSRKLILGHQLEDLRWQSFEFNLVDFLDGLSEDAHNVIGIVLNTPTDLIEIMSQEDREPQTNLKSYLAGMGWRLDDIKETFQEIKDALSDTYCFREVE